MYTSLIIKETLLNLALHRRATPAVSPPTLVNGSGVPAPLTRRARRRWGVSMARRRQAWRFPRSPTRPGGVLGKQIGARRARRAPVGQHARRFRSPKSSSTKEQVSRHRSATSTPSSRSPRIRFYHGRRNPCLNKQHINNVATGKRWWQAVPLAELHLPHLGRTTPSPERDDRRRGSDCPARASISRPSSADSTNYGLNGQALPRGSEKALAARA